MKNVAIILLLLTASFTTVSAQQKTQIKQQAQLMANATIKGDYKTLVKYTHPKIVNMMGGKEKMIAVVNKGVSQMQTNGITFKQALIGEPGNILNTGTGLYAVIPQKLIMNANGRTMTTTSSLLASSTDKGKTWYFTDAGNISDEQLKQLFPGVLGKLTIPKRTMPVVE